MVELVVDGERVTISIDNVVNMAYSGRDQEQVQAHIDEMLADDIIAEAPDTVPDTYRVAPYTVLGDPGNVDVVGTETSGEAELAFFVTGSDIYVAAGSDHTDRALENHDIQCSKQITPNVVSSRAWRLDDIRSQWDKIRMKAWMEVDGENVLYQDAELGELLEPEAILDEVRDVVDTLSGTVIMSGTVSTIGSEIIHGESFSVELQDPETQRVLSLDYSVSTL
jgi:hypothetical protein